MKKVRVEASTKKDRTSEIFGNPMSKKVIRKAQKSKQKNQKKYGDDSKVNYQCTSGIIPASESHWVLRM